MRCRNVLQTVKFRRVGPYVNPANANVSDFSAVKVSGPSSTPRYRCIVNGSRAPVVALTTGIIRYWRLDTPSNGPRPQRYVIITPFYGFFDATVCFFCTLFGQYTLNCLSWDNGLRIATIPEFERPGLHFASSPLMTSLTSLLGGNVQQSAAVRGNTSAYRAPRRSAFELNTNDEGVHILVRFMSFAHPFQYRCTMLGRPYFRRTCQRGQQNCLCLRDPCRRTPSRQSLTPRRCGSATSPRIRRTTCNSTSCTSLSSATSPTRVLACGSL